MNVENYYILRLKFLTVEENSEQPCVPKVAVKRKSHPEPEETIDKKFEKVRPGLIVHREVKSNKFEY